MRLLQFKTEDQLNEEAYKLLEEANLDAKTPGSITRLLLHIYNKIMGTAYEALRINHINAFLSSSTGEFIDEIGKLLNCSRNLNEDDDNYKARISNQTLTLAAANETAVRLAALSIDQVQDIKMKRYTMGTGSFSVFVLTEQPLTAEATLEQVRAAINETVSYGNKFTVESPTLIEVQAGVKLFFVATATERSKRTAITDAKKALKNYINSRSIGEPIIIDEITQRVMEVNEDILKYDLHFFVIGNRTMAIEDQAPRWNERYIESSSVQEAILVS